VGPSTAAGACVSISQAQGRGQQLGTGCRHRSAIVEPDDHMVRPAHGQQLTTQLWVSSNRSHLDRERLALYLL